MFPHRSFQDLGWAHTRGHNDLSSQHIMMYTNTCNFIHQRRFFWFAILICVLYVSFLTPEAFSELFQCSDCFLSICIPQSNLICHMHLEGSGHYFVTWQISWERKEVEWLNQLNWYKWLFTLVACTDVLIDFRTDNFRDFQNLRDFQAFV